MSLFDQWGKKKKAPGTSYLWGAELWNFSGSFRLDFSRHWWSVMLSQALIYFSIIYRKSRLLLATRGSHGVQRFSGWKYPPTHGFGYGQRQESYLLGLILGHIYKLPCEVYLYWWSFSLLTSPDKRLRILRCSNKLCIFLHKFQQTRAAYWSKLSWTSYQISRQSSIKMMRGDLIIKILFFIFFFNVSVSRILFCFVKRAGF